MSRKDSYAGSIPQENKPSLDPKPTTQHKSLFGTTKRAPYGPTAAAVWHDYEQKYPPDIPYHELGEDSRLWNVYNDEAQLADKELVEENSDSLDILLIFAALFSGVVTTFLVEVSSKLDTDYSEVSANLLTETVALLRAGNNETARLAVPAAVKTTGPSTSDVWVNGLWLTSLVLSLSTALIAVLAKQWLRHYSSATIGSARERAFIRQYRWEGFDTWKVQFIIGLLPLGLHASLLLFLAGLVVWLHDLHNTLAQVILAFSGALGLVYLLCNLLPVVIPKCPYRTQVPLLLVSVVRMAISISVLSALALWKTLFKLANIIRLTHKKDKSISLGNAIRAMSTMLSVHLPYYKRLERKLAVPTSNISVASSRPVQWLATSTPNSSAKRIAFHALASCDVDAYFDEGLCDASVDHLNGMKEIITKMISDSCPLPSELADFWAWACASTSSALGYDDDHRKRMRGAWASSEKPQLIVPSLEHAVIAWRSLLQTTKKPLSITVQTPMSRYLLVENDIINHATLLDNYDADADPQLTQHMWDSLARGNVETSAGIHIPTLDDIHYKPHWSKVVFEVLNHKSDYLKVLEYPETHQLPISMAHYFSRQLEEKGWLDHEQWDLVCVEDADGKVSYRPKLFEDSVLEEGMKLFVVWESGEAETGLLLDSEASKQRPDNIVAQDPVEKLSIWKDIFASVARTVKVSDTEAV